MHRMTLLNEKKILDRVVDGDEKAFSALFDQYYSVLLRFVNAILKSSDLSRDTCQEIFLKIWEERQRLSDIHSFRSYLLTVGKNHSLNTLKKVLSEERRTASFLANYREADHGLEEDLQWGEYHQFIEKMLRTLTPQSRQVFQLCRHKGLSYEEAAHVLGISKNVVKKHMVKSMRILRLAVERDLGIAFSTYLP